MVAKSKKTIAVAGTSGKSTTSAMLFQILLDAGFRTFHNFWSWFDINYQTRKNWNAYVGKGDWLIIEADESDGSVVQYEPEIGLFLISTKTIKEIDELIGIIYHFKNNTNSLFIVNQSIYWQRLCRRI